MITVGNYTGFMRTTIRDGCTGKKVFGSYAEAEREIGNLIRKGTDKPERGQIAPYTCKECGRIHIGHSRWR